MEFDVGTTVLSTREGLMRAFMSVCSFSCEGAKRLCVFVFIALVKFLHD